MSETNIILANMPTQIKAYTSKNDDGSYTIVLNSKMTFNQHLKSYYHEMKHIENGDYDSVCNINSTEFHMHQ